MSYVFIAKRACSIAVFMDAVCFLYFHLHYPITSGILVGLLLWHAKHSRQYGYIHSVE